MTTTRADYEAKTEGELRALVFGRAIKCPSEKTWAYDALLKKAVARRTAEIEATPYFV